MLLFNPVSEAGQWPNFVSSTPSLVVSKRAMSGRLAESLLIVVRSLMLIGPLSAVHVHGRG